MNTDLGTDALMATWERTLGQSPTKEQFAIWVELYAYDIVKHAILRTAQKNIEADGIMPLADKVKLAAAIMEVQTKKANDSRGNR